MEGNSLIEVSQVVQVRAEGPEAPISSTPWEGKAPISSMPWEGKAPISSMPWKGKALISSTPQKGQKLLAQSIALGTMTIRKAPCKGKSFKNQGNT